MTLPLQPERGASSEAPHTADVPNLSMTQLSSEHRFFEHSSCTVGICVGASEGKYVGPAVGGGVGCPVGFWLTVGVSDGVSVIVGAEDIVG